MTTHEKLKEICKKIGFTTRGYFWNIQNKTYHKQISFAVDIEINEREIIFTQDFMDKFANIFENEDYSLLWNNKILTHLNAPTEYLYNLINNK